MWGNKYIRRKGKRSTAEVPLLAKISS
uniref:Uncharacterized protein n=1 Tax=Arundo donax TaxID=35708 RepID=A0A0A9CX84_ARUDO